MRRDETVTVLALARANQDILTCSMVPQLGDRRNAVEDLEVRLLGPPRIAVDGQPLEVDTRKAIALLAYIAATGPASRESLAALLWPDSDETRARAALRRTLSTLKGALGGRWLQPGRDLIELRGTMHCDVVAVRRHLEATAGHDHPPQQPCPRCLPELQVAAGLFAGPFLAGFSLRDSETFDTWHMTEAEALQRDHRTVLTRLSQILAAEGRFEEALQHACRQVELDPLQEPAQRRVMLLQAWTGQRGDAAEQYRTFVDTLDRELGVQPLQETTDLYTRILQDDVPAPPTPSQTTDFPSAPVVTADAVARTAVPAVPAATPPAAQAQLVGRDAELHRVTSAVCQTTAGGRLIAIRGEAGIGKTRLAREVLDRLEQSGRRTLSVRCHPSDAQLAYAPIITALGRAQASSDGWVDSLPAHWRAEVARLVPLLRAPAEAAPSGFDAGLLTGPAAQTRFVEGVWRALEAALAGDSPGVLFIDDLHRADAGTVDLLLYLLPRLSQHDIVVMVCWREEEAPGQRWTSALGEAAASGRITDVRLQRLDAKAVGALVAAAHLDGHPALAARLYAETEGLPLAVVAYLDELDADSDDGWSLPSDVHNLFRDRVASVDEMSRQVLSAAAVVGRSFDLDTLIAASGRADEEAVQALETLSARGLVHEAEDGPAEYDFSHALLRSVAYDATSLARRRLLHRRVADSLSRQASPDPAVIALHERLGGRRDRAARMHALAGNQARKVYANRDALEHFQQALALNHPDVAQLHEAIGDLQTLDGEYEAALASYRLAESGICDNAAAAAVGHKVAGVHLRAGAPGAALTRLDAALDAARQPGEERSTVGLQARIHAARALALVQQGQLGQAEDAAQAALRLAEDAQDSRGIARSRNILGVLARRTGHHGDAQRHLAIATDVASRLPELQPHIAALNNLALALGTAGDTERALKAAGTAVELCHKVGDRHREAALHSNLADLLHASGRDAEANEHLTTSARLFAALGEAPERAPELWKLTDW